MPVTIEEEVVLLYTLYVCGRKPSKARATHFIMSKHLMKERDGDADIVTTRESRVENRIVLKRLKAPGADLKQRLEKKCEQEPAPK